MGKALIIAEKPSVASDIAKALGGFKKQDDYLESDRYLLSSAVGHLLELCAPEKYEAKRGKWTFAHLPVIPPHFDLKPIEKSSSRLKTLTKLIKNKDVDSLINACDAGREGELIFRYIVQHSKTNKPIRRLWLQSMTPAAIRESFSALRDDASMRPLADAATCRSESDWLVGINGTRAMTAFNSKSGGFHLTTVGRVQTPTLTLLVEREEKIKKFVSKDYWEIQGTFGAAAGEYLGRWFDESFVREKIRNGESSDLRPERVWDLPQAEAIRDKCQGKTGMVTEESKPTTQAAPLLYDLTSLQRDANGRFGFSAKSTLSIAQALYEKHKVLTYPRTDARALPEDYLSTVKNTLEVLRQTIYESFAGQILSQNWVKPNRRIFNNAKISDHFAIIPTLVTPRSLSEAEGKLYDLVVKRFLAVFFPAAESLVTTRITRVEGEPFKTEGKVLVNPGWLAVYGRVSNEDGEANLVPVAANETVDAKQVEVQANQTKPPARYSEATLLTAMETAGKLVEDDELRDAMAAKGLGTPATRAAVIEGLLHEKYLHRLGRELQPTAKAFSLITLLRGLNIPELCSPEMTGDWEHKLREMELGHFPRADFMERIQEMTRHIVERAKEHESDTVPGDFATFKAPCPKCGGVVKENYKKFQCQNSACDFFLWRVIAGRQFEVEEIEQLLSNKRAGPLEGFRSKLGRLFAAEVKLSEEFKVEFDFGDKDEQKRNADEPVDFTGQEPLGKCPKCGARVFENGKSYVCEKSVGADRTCKFSSSTTILQQAVERSQMAKLLSTGKTDLLEKFISKRNGRAFKAFLVLEKEGKVGFEFAPREFKKKGAAATKSDPKQPVPKLDFSGQESLGKCPKCGAAVFEGPEAYLCEKSQAEAKPCKFKIGKTILQQTVPREQVLKLLSDQRTDLMAHFISRAGRPFSAYLILEEKGKVGFEFPPREDKATS